MAPSGCPLREIPEPEWVQALPRMAAHGKRFAHLPIPAQCYPCPVTPDPARRLALGLRRRCAICGTKLGTGPVYNIWNSGEDLSWEKHPGGVFTNHSPGPMHKSCAVFSALSCPYLRHPTSRARKTTPRGEAAVMGFHQYGIAFFTEPTTPFGTLWLWGYTGPAEHTPFVSARELLPAYDQAICADAQVIDLPSRLYWLADNDPRLKACAQSDEVRLKMLRPGALTSVGGYLYRLALLG